MSLPILVATGSAVIGCIVDEYLTRQYAGAENPENPDRNLRETNEIPRGPGSERGSVQQNTAEQPTSASERNACETQELSRSTSHETNEIPRGGREQENADNIRDIRAVPQRQENAGNELVHRGLGGAFGRVSALIDRVVDMVLSVSQRSVFIRIIIETARRAFITLVLYLWNENRAILLVFWPATAVAFPMLLGPIYIRSFLETVIRLLTHVVTDQAMRDLIARFVRAVADNNAREGIRIMLQIILTLFQHLTGLQDPVIRDLIAGFICAAVNNDAREGIEIMGEIILIRFFPPLRGLRDLIVRFRYALFVDNNIQDAINIIGEIVVILFPSVREWRDLIVQLLRAIADYNVQEAIEAIEGIMRMLFRQDEISS